MYRRYADGHPRRKTTRWYTSGSENVPDPGVSNRIIRMRDRSSKCRVAIDTAGPNEDAYPGRHGFMNGFMSAQQRSDLRNDEPDFGDFRNRNRFPSPHKAMRREGEVEIYETPITGPQSPEKYQTVLSDDDGSENFDFDIPTPSIPVSYSLDESSLELSDYTLESAPPAGRRLRGPMLESNILRSRWNGKLYERGELGAELTISQSTAGPQEKSIKDRKVSWFHLERSVMDFEEFIGDASSVLSESQRTSRDVAGLLRDVQKKHEQQRQYGREMNPNYTSDFFYLDTAKPSTHTSSVSFLAFPYFCLEPYDTTQSRDLPSGSSLHPIRPLLQTSISTTAEKRELAQVVATMPRTRKGECLHVAQIWCLVVNGEFMITCSRLSAKALGGSQVQLHTVTDNNVPAHVKVTAGGDRKWSIPVSPQTTWPEFLSVFDALLTADGDSQGLTARFQTRKGILHGDGWPAARDMTGQIAIELHIEEPIISTVNTYTEVQDYSNPKRTTNQTDEPDGLEHSELKKPRFRGSSYEKDPSLQLFDTIGSHSMQALADSLHQVLLSNRRQQEATAYVECPPADMEEVVQWFTNTQEAGGRSDHDIRVMKFKRKFTLGAKYFHKTFWPSDFKHYMIDKFWGAVYQILSRDGEVFIDGHTDTDADIRAANSMYSLLYGSVCPAAFVLSRTFLSAKEDLLPLPESLQKAWLHVMIAFVLVAQVPRSRQFGAQNNPVVKHLRTAASELNESRHEIFARISPGSLDDFEVCTPTSVVALFANHVSRDTMHGRPDVVSTYLDYCKDLEARLIENPLLRSHREKLRYLEQEIQAILTTLQNQELVVGTVIQSIAQQNVDEDSQWLNSVRPSRQSVLLEQCIASIRGKINTFEGLSSGAQELSEWQRNEMDTRKDRQESAILVFTIVTIIFLPLSFVASVFGINTADIRNTDVNQWAYWASALPLTLVVVVGSLWWAGLFEDLGNWFSNTFSGARKGRARGSMKEVQHVVSRVRRRRSRSSDDEYRPGRGKVAYANVRRCRRSSDGNRV